MRNSIGEKVNEQAYDFSPKSWHTLMLLALLLATLAVGSDEVLPIRPAVAPLYW